ncbi:Sua5/YciO/YrdC/YwlC family protein [Mycoplasma sp. ES3157-GEN-MYC]|uniref:L-threonylcarbamoyladenylate synthase n=1 Tax=Mycoplasma miroungigenitalium TaxID=754515 RepID=A0A6M4JBT1_9MOLU|nr:Sua5/YciO/YrdC/YwlC family protein [Mycoplasma miroungigenitalium]MBU4690694.1 Sua5/YciO/YrdC/YwlC family protein [Mycoplasma miroungigenitalium]MBU4691963.1 Sua5/YciO/YrdC/YwlC family protein [Mycoplasma miroungigenitalium]QJR43815.1 Sua5/YciO/YrdC/YwlC family protein [Mycoplasma miroungigenitalium]
MNKYEKIFITTTDTVCGIGGPISEETLETIYELKQRPAHKKIMILVGSLEQAQKFKEWNEEANNVALKFWPGAVSIVVNNQGFRMPNHPKLNEFLLKNGPMYVTSANISGQEPIQINQAKIVFPQITNVFNFGQVSGKASRIYNVDSKEWIR